MLRLKSRTNAPPGGFLYHQKETGWRNWVVDPPSQWDFNRLCTALQQHRKSNPQFKLQKNMGIIQNEVDAANAIRVAAMPNTESYIVTGGNPIPKTQAPSTVEKLQHVAGAVKRIETGAAALLAWEKSGDKPVVPVVSSARAAICAECPNNGKGDLTRWFTVPIAEMIRGQMQRLHDLKLETSSDKDLGVCEACSCPLRLKVHTPFKFVKMAVTPEIEADLNISAPECWMLTELHHERATEKSSEAPL